MPYCDSCGFWLYLDASDEHVYHACKNCGFRKQLNPQTKEDALILETNFRSGSSANGASSGITVNAYTLLDPTLPHVKTLRCANSQCPVRDEPAKWDVIYIKTDPSALKFQYICTNCKTQWTS
jgi:DNA-directed RNA polymerase subunit M/transcription elongation factor TFIIS